MQRVAAVVLFFAGVSVAGAAGQYDGKWVGTAPEAGHCGMLTVTLTVKENAITGTVSGRYGSPNIDSGTVSPDGTAIVTYAPRSGFSGNIRFAGAHFLGNFNSRCGVRAVTGSKVTQ